MEAQPDLCILAMLKNTIDLMQPKQYRTESLPLCPPANCFPGLFSLSYAATIHLIPLRAMRDDPAA
jgi:hypothetical protein